MATQVHDTSYRNCGATADIGQTKCRFCKQPGDDYDVQQRLFHADGRNDFRQEYGYRRTLHPWHEEFSAKQKTTVIRIDQTKISSISSFCMVRIEKNVEFVPELLFL